MVLPTKDYEHCFNVNTGAELQTRIKWWIREHYSTLLGKDIRLLNLPNGIDLIEHKVKKLMAEHGMGRAEEVAAA